LPAPQVEPVPTAVARVVEVMQGFPGDWCLCGGWGVDAWLGRQTREHKDVDIVAFEGDLDAVLDHFGGWQLWAHDENDPDSEQQWDRRRLVLPAHIHARRDDVNLDIQVTERNGDEWVLNYDPRIVIDAQQFIETSGWGVPALAPEVILFYKTLERRPQDLEDLEALLPHLTSDQAAWLANAIALAKGSPA
jgi:hypothetical protein